MPIKFYMTPGSCTTGIHILLETIGVPFEAWIVNIPAGDNLKPEYLANNPKGTIPTLVLEDGSALTEFQSIAYWLALSYPRRKLLPENPLLAAKAIEAMAFACGHLHGQAFARIFTTDKFALDESQHDAVKARGREMVDKDFAILDLQLAGKEYIADEFSIGDAAIFYNEFWADRLGIPLPPNVKAHYDRMRARPIVKAVLAEEGYR